MKNQLNIKETALTPSVQFNEFTNCLEITGRSVPMDAEKFWAPVLSWYIRQSVITPKISVSFDFDYLNSGSQQFVVRLLKMMSESDSKGLTQIGNVTWKYEDYDEDLYEMGHDFSFVSGLQFRFLQKESNSFQAA